MPSAWLSKSHVPDYFVLMTFNQLWSVVLVEEEGNSFWLLPPWWVYFVHPQNAVHQVAFLDFDALKNVDVACCVLNLWDLSRKMHDNLPWSEIFSIYFLPNLSTWTFSIHTHFLLHVTYRIQMENEQSNAFFLLRPSSWHIAWLAVWALHYLKCALLTLWESSLTSKPLWAHWVSPICFNNALKFISEAVFPFNKLYRT